MRVVILLPTYNERGNIGPLLEALLEKTTTHDVRILVCDDSSPDGTADVVRAVQKRYPSVHLSVAPRAGLGAAYVRGMRIALGELAADAIVQMDADFSHDPADVPRLLAALESGADFAIGSRYVPGGRIPDKWSALRRANSRWGNRVARYLVGLHPIRDCTSGFRAIRGTLLAAIALDKIRVQGYAFLVACLYEAKLHGARIAEIPIVFSDRARGASKLGLRDIVEFIVNAVWLRFRAPSSFVRYLIVGASGVAVNLAVFVLLLDAGTNKYAASPICTVLSILSNLALHRFWSARMGTSVDGVDAVRNAGDSIPVRRSVFNAAALAALAASYGTFVALSLLLPRVPPTLFQLASVIPAALINYFGNAYWKLPSIRGGRGA